MKIKTFGVVGAGQMGSGIAQVAAQSGLKVILNDIKAEFVERGLGGISAFLTRSVENGRLQAEDKQALLANIVPSTDIKDMAGTDLLNVKAFMGENKYKIIESPFDGSPTLLVPALNPDVAIMLGGAPVTQDVANLFGADGYAESAGNAVAEGIKMISRLREYEKKKE